MLYSLLAVIKRYASSASCALFNLHPIQKKEVPIYTKENSANVLNLPTIAIVVC